ncbi:MAG: NAD(P)/FAD-dependent oxidoreductase [Aeromicrobium erythreum]
MSERADVVVLGGGHNALVAATLLARDGLRVVVLERLDQVGGAAVSARPWPEHDARLSRYSYLVSLFPRQLVDDLGLRLELRSRPTTSYTPYMHPDGTPDGLLVETEPGPATAESFRRLTGDDRELAAWRTFSDAVSGFAAAVEPTLLGPLPRVEDVRSRVDVRTWDDLVERPLGATVRERFAHDLVRGVVATDGLIGISTSLEDPERLANRCFLYHVVGNGTGEWRVPVGGMGAVTDELARVAREAGTDLRTRHTVTAVEPHADGVVVRAEGPDGPVEVEAAHVLSGVAPAVLDGLRGRPVERPSGAQLKVNLLVSRLPRLRSGEDPAVAFAGTFHVGEGYAELEEAYRSSRRGEVGGRHGELYCHTLTDPSILGPELRASGAHTLTWFGLHTPAETLPDETSGRAAYEAFRAALDEHLAEPLEPLLLGVEHKTPRDVEAALAMPGGHIFHGDLAWPWLAADEDPVGPAERWGVATPDERVLVCGSGSRRGGAVSGLGGLHAAEALREILG